MTPDRRPAPSLAELAFWLMAAMVVLNMKSLDEVVEAGFVVAWAVTVLLWALHLFLASLVLRLPWREVLGPPGAAVLAALAVYVVIGTIISIGAESPQYRYALRYSYAAAAIVATAVGVSLALRRVGMEGLALGLLPIMAVSCLATLFSPWLPFVRHINLEWQQNVFIFRAGGLFGSPNEAGMAACAAAALALAMLRTRRVRVLAASVLALGAGTVVFTGSRGSLLALGLVLLLFAAMSRPGAAGLRRLLLAALGLAGAVGLLLGLAPLVVRAFAFRPVGQLETMLVRLTDFDALSVVNRVDLMRAAAARIARSPFVGHGLGEFHEMRWVTIDCFDLIAARHCGTHNFFLAMIGEAGIAPALLFLLFLAAVFRARLRLGPSPAANAAAAWTVILAVDGLTTHSIMIGTTWNPFLIGAICAAIAYAGRTTRRGAGRPRGGRRPAALRRSAQPSMANIPSVPAANAASNGWRPRLSATNGRDAGRI